MWSPSSVDEKVFPIRKLKFGNFKKSKELENLNFELRWHMDQKNALIIQKKKKNIIKNQNGPGRGN